MLISCKCLNITGYNSSVDEHVLRRTGAGQSLAELAPGTDELQGHDGLAAFLYTYREFAKTAIGPISDLAETINQKDLAFEVPLKHTTVKYCINCETITHIKSTSSPSEFWINSKLLTTPERMRTLKDNKLYSKVFGILLTKDSATTTSTTASTSLISNRMDGSISTSPVSGATTTTNMSTSTPTTPTSTNAPANCMDMRNVHNSIRGQAYIKKLTQHLEEQLERDYNETNERISRFIEQQAAILESNRDKAKQEYQILVSKINRVPDELKVINNNSSMNNVNNNEDLTSATTARKSTSTPPPNNALENQNTNSDKNVSNQHVAGNTHKLFTLKEQQLQQEQQTTAATLDTPPATPDSTPMSVGNSPTFRQQTSIFGNITAISGGNSSRNSSMGGINDGIGGMNAIDECIFDLDGMESYPVSVSDANQMSDVEETEDAEDALGELEGLQIPRTMSSRSSGTIAKSLPISIVNITRNTRFNDIDDLETEELEEIRNVDIAASIQALARSVHGDTVFGDLPRPRFSTQI